MAVPRGEGGRAAWPAWGGCVGDGGYGGRVRVAGAHTGEDGVGSREGLDEVEVVEDGERWQATRGGGVGALEEGLGDLGAVVRGAEACVDGEGLDGEPAGESLNGCRWATCGE